MADCEGISREIAWCSEVDSAFVSIYKGNFDLSKKIQEISQKKLEIEEKVESIQYEYFFESKYLANMEDIMFWLKVTTKINKDAVETQSSSLEKIHLAIRLCSNMRRQGTLNSTSYKRFIRRLLSNKKIASNIDETFKLPISLGALDAGMDYQSVCLSAISNIFLETYLDKDTVLGPVEVPVKIQDNFGARLFAGRLLANTAGNYAGYNNNGAELCIDRAGDYLGMNMQRGIIRAKQCGVGVALKMSGGYMEIEQSGYNLGNQMEGGTVIADVTGESLGGGNRGGNIFVKEAKHGVGSNMESGTLVVGKTDNLFGISAKGGVLCCEDVIERFGHNTDFDANVHATFLVNKESTASDNCQKKLVYMRDDDGTYYSFFDKKKKQPIPTIYPSEFAIDMRGLDGGLFIFETAPLGTPLFASNMNQIFIIKNAGLFTEIGLNMRAGLVIIEDDSISESDLKSKIVPHPGGLIVRRVPDTDNPGKTKLICLDDDAYWRAK
jgi:hypothetical protein